MPGEELSDALAKLSRIKIPEIAILEQYVQEAMKVTKRTEDARKTLEEIERTLVIKYNQKINLRILILTIVSIIIGIISILMQTGLLTRLFDELTHLH